MDINREEALSILGLGPSATDEEAARAYTRRKQPLKRMLVRAASVDQKNEYRGRLRALVQARDVALGRTSLDDRTRKLVLSEQPLLDSLDYDTLSRAQALSVLDLAEGATDAAIQAAHTERYRFLSQRLGRARNDPHFDAIRAARVKLLGVRRFLLERTETLDLTAVFAEDFADEDDSGFEVDEKADTDPEITVEPIESIPPTAPVRPEPEPEVAEPESEPESESFFDDEDEGYVARHEVPQIPRPAAFAPARAEANDDDEDLEHDQLEETLDAPQGPFEFDGERTRTSVAPQAPDPDDWEGDADQIRAVFERFAGPLRERLAASTGDELRSAYERALSELESKRDEALRRRGE